MPHIGCRVRMSLFLFFFGFLYYTTILEAQTLDQLSKTELKGEEYYEYEVKKNETLYGIAKRFGWNSEELHRINPSVKENPKKGTKIYYPTGEAISIIDTTQDNAGELPLQHIVKKGENVYSISRLYDVPLEEIYRLNPQIKTGVKTGETIEIPIIGRAHRPTDSASKLPERSQTPILYPDQSPSQSITQDGTLIYFYPDTINTELDTIALPQEVPGVRVAVLLDEPSGKKDVDFTRGFLIALSEMKNTPYKINLKVMDGGMSSSDILDTLENYSPNLIISTADRTFPIFLADYGNTHEVPVVNVFDVKGDLYEENPSVIQILPPSVFYNNLIANKIYKENKSRNLIFVGDADDNDGIATELNSLFENYENKSLEEFGAMEPDLFTSYLIYSRASKKEEVSDFLKNIENLTENNPTLDLRIIGRSSWIAMLSDLGDQFEEYRVWVPSRVWLDTGSKEWEAFNQEYENNFNGVPLRSIPNFAASGYDMAKYFIPKIAVAASDYKNSNSFSDLAPLQNDINLKKAGSNGGYINETAYIITFAPEGKTERMIAR